MDGPEEADAAWERITAVIVTFRSAGVVERRLRSVAAAAAVVVVDNASDDDTRARVARAMPMARIIANERNLGFGAASSQGLETVATTFALLVGPDAVLHDGAAAALAAAADAYPEAAIVAPALLDGRAPPARCCPTGISAPTSCRGR